MFEGRLEAIYIGEAKGGPLSPVETVVAVAGAGLQGDRYFRQAGTFSKPGQADREVTLIEAEAVEAFTQESGSAFQPHEARRNLLTQNVPLNHLVGQTFAVGDVILRGIRLCEPCTHLEKLTRKGVRQGLLHRAGLRAQILRGGTLRPGNLVRPVTAPAAGE
jgi:MOSC domain-containing protein YiiM